MTAEQPDALAGIPARAARREPQPRPIVFRGRAQEYFGIWIANILLSLATLGIYSAWAKVRRVTYFHGRTEILGHALGYHATGFQILRGRIAAVAVYVVAQTAIALQPLLGIPAALAFVLSIPWILNASMRFSSRMTSYRNVRLNWHGTYGKSMLYLVVGPVLGILSLGILLPYFSKAYYQYFADYHAYGTKRLRATLHAGSFYVALLGTLVTVIPLTFILLLALASLASPADLAPDSGVLLGVTGYVVFGLFLFSLSAVYRILCRNILLRNLSLAGAVRFGSTLSPARYVWISLSNSLAVIGTLGLLLPWAQVRMYRYLAHGTTVRAAENLDTFIDTRRAERSAFGEEFAEIEGLGASI